MMDSRSYAIHEGDAKPEVNLLAFAYYMHVFITQAPGRKKVLGKPHRRVETRNKRIEEILQVELTDCPN